MIYGMLRVANALGCQHFIGILIDMMNKIGFGIEIVLVVVRIEEAHVVWQGAGMKHSADWHVIWRNPRRWLVYLIIIVCNHAGS